MHFLGYEFRRKMNYTIPEYVCELLTLYHLIQKLYALRFTLYAFSFTLYALRFQLLM